MGVKTLGGWWKMEVYSMLLETDTLIKSGPVCACVHVCVCVCVKSPREAYITLPMLYKCYNLCI